MGDSTRCGTGKVSGVGTGRDLETLLIREELTRLDEFVLSREVCSADSVEYHFYPHQIS